MSEKVSFRLTLAEKFEKAETIEPMWDRAKLFSWKDLCELRTAQQENAALQQKLEAAEQWKKEHEWRVEKRVRAAERDLAASRDDNERYAREFADKQNVAIVKEMDKLVDQLAASREQVETLRKALAEHQQKLASVSGAWSKWPHITPPADFIENNSRSEPEGERLRAELSEWLSRNKIVGILMDTENHVVDIHIGELPPRLKWVLRTWGAITVVDDDDAAALAATEPK